MKEYTEAEMLHKAAAYCTGSERCIQEVANKISQGGLSAEASQRIIDRLVQEKFIDERRYSLSFVSDKLRFNKWGRIKIGYELQRKQISQTIRQEALDSIDDTLYRSILFDLLKNKKRTTKGKDERDLFNKLLRFAAGRGFESQETITCLKRLFNENDYDDYDGLME